MYCLIAERMYGGSAAKVTNGRRGLQIETKAEVALFAEKIVKK